MARRFWIKFSKNLTLALYTPFVVCLASGISSSILSAITSPQMFIFSKPSPKRQSLPLCLCFA
ncbi:hypothetical protein HYC85_030008 [Camellia sinensis]|uniref:Uncharacterized protein n=1 Tax=Camellia sinensis TaxID=4442 RepID=A0A7J7G063_CAMSI|nr:hypothetical protein HYC85_030008 [Camellia sinensis]